MRGQFSLTTAAISLFFSAPVWAQPATTVQLPTFNIFTVQTAVSVPDGGVAYLGGINRARDGSVRRGFGNRAIGMDRGASGMSVHATIIDHKEIDEALLAAAAARRGAAVDPAVAKAAALSSHVGRSGPGAPRDALPPVDSVAAIRARNTAAADSRAGEAAECFAKARQAELDGKPAVARIFYQMVVRRDAGELTQAAQARLASLASGPQVARR